MKFLLPFIYLISLTLSLGFSSQIVNLSFQRSVELQNQAKETFEYGDYDKGAELAIEARKYSELALSENQLIRMKFWVWSKKNLANDAILLSFKNGVTNFPTSTELYNQSTNFFQLGLTFLYDGTNEILNFSNFQAISNNLSQSGDAFAEAEQLAKQALSRADEYKIKQANAQQIYEQTKNAQYLLTDLKNRYALLLEQGVIKKGDDFSLQIEAHISAAEKMIQSNEFSSVNGEVSLAQKVMDEAVLNNEANATYLFAVQEHAKATQKFGNKTSIKKKLAKAETEIEKAKAELDNKNYQQSIVYSKIALEILTGIDKTLILPNTYTVRLLDKSDSLWRIAGYYFVYNNPNKWPILYKANKSRLKNPKNPHLIFPGQVFIIPELEK